MCFSHHVHIIQEISGENFKLQIVERVVYFIPRTLKECEAVSTFMLLHI